MFDNIVVGTDGSDTAAMAVAVAADLAKRHNSVLHLVNAYNVPTSGVAVVGAGSMAAADPLLSSASLKEASEKLLAAAAELAAGAKVEAHAVVGSPADVVITVAREVGADLIVVGSKGMKGARRMIGSVPNSVAHNAPCHVLVAKTA